MRIRELLIDSVDRRILEILRNSKHSMSTYEIAKKGGFSWSAANAHCYKLKSMGLIEGYIEEVYIGKMRTLWTIGDRASIIDAVRA